MKTLLQENINKHFETIEKCLPSALAAKTTFMDPRLKTIAFEESLNADFVKTNVLQELKSIITGNSFFKIYLVFNRKKFPCRKIQVF